MDTRIYDNEWHRDQNLKVTRTGAGDRDKLDVPSEQALICCDCGKPILEGQLTDEVIPIIDRQIHPAKIVHRKCADGVIGYPR